MPYRTAHAPSRRSQESSARAWRPAAALHHHVARCVAVQGQWFQLRCVAESVHQFVAQRFVTTVATVALLICAAGLMA